MEQNSNPSTLYHFNRYKAATISASLRQRANRRRRYQKAMQAISARIGSDIPDRAERDFQDYAESSSNILFAFIGPHPNFGTVSAI
jgi:HAE1 family hydrophobic/amphiphilic exporter-1/multidrug efflux pump